MAQSYDAIVVGAGINGASTAYHLRLLGAGRVLLLERGGVAAGGTGKSAAVVRQNYSTPLMTRLARKSIEKFRAMRQELGQDGGFEQVGYFMVLAADHVAGQVANVAMQRSLGVDVHMMEDAEIDARLPWLNREGVAGISYEVDGGCADPIRTTEAYVSAFERLGGEVRLKTPVRALTRAGDRITGVLLDEGSLAAGTVVNAGGPWAHFLADSANLELPLRTVREQDTVWEGRPNRPLPTGVISLATDGLYIRPLGQRRFIVGRGFPKEYVDVDPYNYKETADDAIVSLILERLEYRIPSFAGAKLIDSYAALYDVTPDWYPFIGPRRGLAGYCDMNGGSGHGFKVGPAFGEELARWIVTGQVEPDFAGLSHDRIVEGRLFTQTFGGNRG
ncbi:MAG: FAD-binding oxidoreductase [Alphaproteobacteria bacterium]|nr:FAD-binding oxidoreductase [Alphaproteobacteria bacterium]